MRYWVYINEKVDGPYDETNLVTLEGFTPDTLIQSEEAASQGEQKWEKASSIFEFDEVPVNEPPAQSVSQQPVGPQQPAMPTAQPSAETQALLTQLEALTSGMAGLQSKLNSMQQNLDNALEENKKLSAQIDHLSNHTDGDMPSVPSEEPHSNTITLTKHDSSAFTQPEPSPEQQAPFPQQADPEEEEVIIRSALDSIYGEKPVEINDTFQDLLPERTAEQEARKKEEEERTIHALETELQFTPMTGEDAAAQPQPAQEASNPEPVVAPSVSEPQAQPLPDDVLSEIEKEVTFISLEKEKEPQPSAKATAEEVEVKTAVVTTPDLEEAAKDALIAELTASPKEDVLDQIIAERNQQTTPKQTSTAGEVALGAATAGLAAASLVSLVENDKQPVSAPVSIAPDKKDPKKLEEVLPAEQMPEDVPAVPVESPVAEPEELPQLQEVEPVAAPVSTEAEPPSTQEPEPVDLPELDSLNADEKNVNELKSSPEEEPFQEKIPVQEETPAQEEAPVQEEAPAQEETPAQEEAPVQEEAPTQEEAPAQEETPTQEETPAQEEAPVQEEAPAQEETPAQEEAPVQEEASAQEEPAHHPSGAITDKDLQDAFGKEDEDAAKPVVSSSTIAVPSPSGALPAGNPNDLTEIELKEGSTYLISDFVPPAQFTNNVAEIMGAQTAALKNQATQTLNTDGLPNDLTATQVSLENTIQAKRGATFDIKTVPMVPEPGESDRIDVNELTDVNTQHGVKRSGGGLAKSTKMILLGGILLLGIVLYVALGILKWLPSSINVFAGKKQTQEVAQTSKELLPEANPKAATSTPAAEQKSTSTEQVQQKVQNFPLPNGLSLKAFIESKYPAISPNLITWETTPDVEPDNYAVLVKVPPENPQSFKTVYRFKYNTVSGMLVPTVSDAKNLLDQAYGIQPATPTATTKKAPSQTAVTKPRSNSSVSTGTRKATTRK